MHFKNNHNEMNKNIKTVIAVFLIISIIPLVFFLSRDTQAEMVFPVEAIINVYPSLNIRPEPNRNSTPIGSIQDGEEVLLLENVLGEEIDGDTTWYRIDYNNLDGYVSAQYVTIQGWSPELPSVADDQEFEQYLNEQGFPSSYRQALRELHKKYPNWKFTALKINTSFDSMLNNQYRPEGSINYIPSSYPDSFKSTASKDFNKETNTWVEYEPGWVAASKEAISYYMDPRNSLDESQIFMFESLSYNPEIHTSEGAAKLLAGTFMDSDYYLNAYMQAAEISQVSPYHLISRTKVEVGAQGSDATSGVVPGLEGYYNFYSIGAFGSSTNPLINGLYYARDGESNNPARRELLRLPWTSQEKAIIGGSIFIGEDYINNYQNTPYLQKFDLLHNLNYLHQYMTAIISPSTDATNMYNAYKNQGNLGEAKEFLIPVFSSIPEMNSPYPGEISGTPNNWLRSIYIDDALLPGFQTSIYQYEFDLNVPNNTITLNANSYNPYATIDGIGTYTLQLGRNAIKLTVTATNGTQRFYEIIINYQGQMEHEVEKVQSDVYQIQPNGYIYGLDEKSGLDLAENAKQKIKTVDGTSLSIVSADGQEKPTGKLATGDLLYQKKDDEIVGTYTFILLGDINGDGFIDILDVDTLMRHLSNYLQLNDVNLSAANVLQDAEVDIFDVDLMMRYICGYIDIDQNLNANLNQ